MAIYAVAGQEFDIPSGAALIDTNVIVAYFDSNDQKHNSVEEFFTLSEGIFFPVVPVSVLVEAWGLLVGQRGRPDNGIALIEWLLQTNAVVVVPDSPGALRVVGGFAKACEVDVVDALLVWLSHDIAEKCSFSGPIPIATMDLRDFYHKIIGRIGKRVSLIDLNYLEVIEYEAANPKRRVR